MTRIAWLTLLFAGCGSAAAPPPDAADPPGLFRCRVEHSEVPLFVTVRATGEAVAPGPGSSRLVPCEVGLTWGDGTDAATAYAPGPVAEGAKTWKGSIPVAETRTISFHLPLPPVVKVDFEYVEVKVTPRVNAEGQVRFEVDPVTYSCIR